MAKQVRIVICGFGKVGRHFARLISLKRQQFIEKYGLELELIGVGELHGSILSKSSLDTKEIIEFYEDKGSLAYFPSGGSPEWKGIDIIREADADILVETTPTNICTGEPALSHIRLALSRGLHVVSANKGPFIRSFHALKSLANDHGVNLKLSAAAAAALPTLDVAETCLAGTDIRSIEGILNGTTNFILTRMRISEESFEEALQEAQRLGIAEADPALDVEGFDTANKLALIANVTMKANLLPDHIDRQGITEVDGPTVRKAASEGKIMRLVGRAEKIGSGQVRASVAPILLPANHPLSSVDGAEKGITYTTDTMDRVTVTGGKSDPVGAAAALLKDLINIYRTP